MKKKGRKNCCEIGKIMNANKTDAEKKKKKRERKEKSFSIRV